MKKTKYNLTILQKIALPFIWIVWILIPVDERKTWHLVKKGMEKHEHKFTKFYMIQGYPHYECSHEGCNKFTNYL